MKPITVRKAEIDDAAGLSELFVEFIGEASNGSAMKRQIETISALPHYFAAVACEGTQVVGTAMGIICYDLVGQCKPFMLIENVVVSSRYQGRGIGKLLMRTLEEFARQHLCSYIILVSESKREDSHRFYESIGYSTDQRGFKKSLKKPGST